MCQLIPSLGLVICLKWTRPTFGLIGQHVSVDATSHVAAYYGETDKIPSVWTSRRLTSMFTAFYSPKCFHLPIFTLTPFWISHKPTQASIKKKQFSWFFSPPDLSFSSPFSDAILQNAPKNQEMEAQP